MEKRKVSARELKQPIVKSEDLSAALKRLAAEQPIRVALTEEQYRGLLGTWNEKDPHAAGADHLRRWGSVGRGDDCRRLSLSRRHLLRLDRKF
jgi:hypothetical protein